IGCTRQPRHSPAEDKAGDQGMSWECRAMKRVVMGLAGTAIAAALAGCAGGLGGQRQACADAASTDSKDRVTASDESEGSKRARVRMELAAAYYGRGQLTTALDEVKMAIASDLTNAAAFNLRGLIYA